MRKHFLRLSLFLVIVLMLGAQFASVTAQDVAREDTVIFDTDSSEVPNYNNFNPYVPNSNRNTGGHQAMWEPLFVLNYETGEIMPWLGESFTHNDAQDVWTLKLRD